MSDFNLFSSKTDIKKLLFTTEKFKFDDQCSNDSWQDIPGVTPTSILASFVDNQQQQQLQTSSLSDNRNENGWETVDDYSTMQKPFGLNSKKPPGYCRLDRRGHWLLLPPPPLIQSNTNKVVTYYDNKRITRDIKQNYHDSSDSFTVSVDLQMATDEFTSDPDDFDGKNLTRQYQNLTTDNIRKNSR